MGNELTIARAARPRASLPPRVAALARGACTVEHGGAEPTRYHLPDGWSPVDELDREEAQTTLLTLEAEMDPDCPFAGTSGADAKLAIVTALLTGLAKGNNAADGIDAKFDLYEVSLDDLPAWAVAEAARRWIKRDCPESIDKRPNYEFAPGPSTLGAIARIEIAAHRRAADECRKVVRLMTSDEARDPTPLPRPEPALIGPGVPVPLLRKM